MTMESNVENKRIERRKRDCKKRWGG